MSNKENSIRIRPLLNKKETNVLKATNTQLIKKSQEKILTLTNTQIINYILLQDNKNTINQINENFLQMLNSHKLTSEMVKTLYLNHLEFTINKEYHFSKDIYFELLKDDIYLKLKKTFLETKKYIDTFIEHNTCSFSIKETLEENPIYDIINLYDEKQLNLISPLPSPSPLPSSPLSRSFSIRSKLPLTSSLKSPLKSPLPLSPNSESSSGSSSLQRSLSKRITSSVSQVKHKFDRNPKNSIFSNITPKKMAKALHKLSIKLFYLINIGEFEYISKDEKRYLQNNYNIYYANFFPNVLSKLNYEIEIYCESDKLKLLFNNFKECIEYFFEVQNIPLIRMFLNAFTLFGQCLNDEVKSYTSNVENKLKEIKINNKYIGLNPAYNIKTKFIGILSSNDNFEIKLEKLEKVIALISETKQVISNIEDSNAEIFTECIVFEYIQPNKLIKDKLYKSHTSGNIQCIKDKC